MRPFRSRFVTALAAALLSFALFGTSASAGCGPSDPGVPTLCAGVGSTPALLNVSSTPARLNAPPFSSTTFSPGDPGVPSAASATPSDPGVPSAASATPSDPGVPQ